LSDLRQEERQRQERANFTSAFSRRAWQPSEQPRTASRIVAVSVAVTLTAGVALGIGVMRSYNGKLAAEEKAKAAALTRSHTPFPNTPPSPSGGSSAGSKHSGDPRSPSGGNVPAPAPNSGIMTHKRSVSGASLPFGSHTKANLFVQFAQVRLVKQGDAQCRLTARHRVGVLDRATVAALACFQKANDSRFHGVTARTDGPGRLGRSTMAALLMAHFGTSTSVQGLAPGDRSNEVSWLKNALVWAGNSQLDDGDIAASAALTKVNIDYIAGGPRPAYAMDGSVQTALRIYQRDVGIPVTGRADSRTLAALHGVRVKSQRTAGVVTGHNLPAPAGRR
jgi:hypothetical protein